MMNKIAVSYIVNVLRFVIACWAFIELYYAWIELANIIGTEKFPFEVTINMIPLGLLTIVAIITTIFIKFKRRNIKHFLIGCTHYSFHKKMSGKKKSHKRHAEQHLFHFGTG